MDSHFEAAEQKAAAQFARIVLEWGKCNHPAPVNILSMPYWASIYLYRALYDLYRALYAESADRLHIMLSDQNNGLSEVDVASAAIPAGQHTLGHLSYNADLDELKDQIATQLQSQFGDYEDNGTLIDKAVKVLNRRMEEKIDKMEQKINKIDDKIDKMEEKITKGISQRLEELINAMPQRPMATEASACQ